MEQPEAKWLQCHLPVRQSNYKYIMAQTLQPSKTTIPHSLFKMMTLDMILSVQ